MCLWSEETCALYDFPQKRRRQFRKIDVYCYRNMIGNQHAALSGPMLTVGRFPHHSHCSIDKPRKGDCYRSFVRRGCLPFSMNLTSIGIRVEKYA